MPSYCSLALLLLCSWGISARADWNNWRGPSGDGRATGTGYPLAWSADRNIAWKIDLPGKGGSTPIIADNDIFLTAGVDGKNALIRYDRSGKQVWLTTFGDEVPGKHRKGSGSNPSPVTDGQTVFVYFKSGDLAAVDLQGKVLWHRNLQQDYGPDTLWWDLGTSPVLTSQYLVVACIHSGPSYLAALDKQTGKTVWKVDRETGAPEEAAQTYATPVVTVHNGQEQIVVLGADQVTCHAAADGQQLWYLDGMNPGQDRYFRSIASPVITNGIVIAPYARGRTLTAIRLGGSGNISKTHVLWQHEGFSSDVPTPAAADGLVYVCTDRGSVGCFEAETGVERWKTDLDKNRNNYSASPILVDGRLYVVREDAATFVLDAQTGQPLDKPNTLPDEFLVSTPAFSQGDILLRSLDRLFCIRQRESASR